MPSDTNALSLLEANQASLLVSQIRDVAIVMLSPDGRVATWNARAQRANGYTAQEIVGESFARFYTPEDQAASVPERALQTARETGVFEASGWCVRKDGSRFWAQVVIDALHDDEGKVIAFAKITRDMTASRLAEERERAASQEQLQARTDQYRDLLRLFEQAPGFVCFFRGPTHIYELQNSAHHRLAEYKDIIGKPVRAALPELEGQGFFELLDTVYASGKPYVGRALPLAVKPADGMPAETRFIDFVYQPIVDEAGQTVGIFSQGSDVTEQVLYHQSLDRQQRELEEVVAERTAALEDTRRALALAHSLQLDNSYLKSMFEQAPGFICVLKGREHRFEVANAAYRSLTGKRELIGKTVREALPEVDGQGFFELLDGVFDKGQAHIGRSVPLELVDAASGATVQRYLDFIYQPLLDAEGKAIGIFVQGSDVTEQRKVQDELERYQRELEVLVHERTAELQTTQTALQHSQKLEAIGKLTGGVAHDFNNILQVIGGNLQLVEETARLGEPAARQLSTAIGAVERGAKLAAQLLAFARRQPLQPAVLNPAKVMQEMDDLLRRALGETIAVETIKAGGLWNTYVDPYQLENVILNLAINARDAMPGGGKLTIELSNAMLDDQYVSAEQDLQPGQYVLFAISDNGCGMSREVLERACEPFYTTKPEGHGTGLGLSMAYGFVKQTGGHFQIYSEPGHGTTIKMYFPRSYETQAEERVLVSGPVVGGSETILVVEDDPAVQATVVQMLGSLGYRVLKADNAENALIILKSGLPVDLLFTDVVMPGKLRSPELARQAKILHPEIEVLFTSGYTQNAIVHDGKLDAGVQLLSKPYRREQLARKIRHMLANRQQANAPAPTAPASSTPAQKRVLVVEDDPDVLPMTCALIELLGHQADGSATPAAALDRLAHEQYDVLLTDFALPGMDGLELARQARLRHPRMHIIVASGYGHLTGAAELGCVTLPKPFTGDELGAVLMGVGGGAGSR